MVMGGVVLAVNLPGVKPGELMLDGPTLANIYLGKITKWDDPAIKKLNPGAKLPATAIAVVHRSDGSGTTFIFTDYLSKVSPEWKSKSARTPRWNGRSASAARAMRASRRSPRAPPARSAMSNTPMRCRTSSPTRSCINHEGSTVSPESQSFQAAAANADWQKAPGFYLLLTDQPGKASWPITGASFILLHLKQEKPETAKAVLEFFDWSYKHGQKMAEELAYVPIPDNVVKLVETSWTDKVKDATGKPIWPATH